MQIQIRKVDSISPYETNPRRNEQAVAATARSIREFGWRQPIVVDEAGVIIIGHTRLKAAISMGLEEVPVHVATDLSPEQVQALRVADNKTGELADWDLDLLEGELASLLEKDVDLLTLGFNQGEIDRLIGGDRKAKGLTDPDAAPAPPPDPVTQPGDLIILGDHRLVCGDSREPEAVATLLDGSQVNLVVTDPPYNVAYEGKTAEALKIQNDQMTPEQFREFLVAALAIADAALTPGGSFYVWCASLKIFDFIVACESVGWEIRQHLIWVKQTMVLGRQDYQWWHEPCLYGWKAGGTHAWYSDRKQTTVLEFDRPTRSVDHPTMKPVDLIEYQVANSSKKGQLVYDPFTGSGSTLIACERSGRKCRSMELDPRYCDVIVRRWEEFTGQKAERR